MKLPLSLIFFLAASLSATARSATNAVVPVTARDFYNSGTQLLAAKKYSEAEKMFQAALAAQDDAVQPVSLYNLGHARFDSGLERLKQGPDAQKVKVQGQAALAAGEGALRQSDSALAQSEVGQLVDAYLAGRGARRQLREAQKAVSAAMDVYGKTLEQWLRAADDFKGAVELNPRDTNAQHNAQIVERGIARLVDTVRQMQSMMGQMGQQRQQLGQAMSKLKGRIPAPDAPPGSGGEDDEDDQGAKPDSLAGQKEPEGRQNEQMQFAPSPDRAAEILNGLMLDGTRRLEMSEKEGTPPKDRKGRNW
jgi:tetratricopeptide (TPR) repeat protein